MVTYICNPSTVGEARGLPQIQGLPACKAKAGSQGYVVKPPRSKKSFDMMSCLSTVRVVCQCVESSRLEKGRELAHIIVILR